MIRTVALWMTLAAAAVLGSSSAEADSVGRKIDDFRLQDFRGKEVSLSDFQSDRLVVVAFLGTECPLAKLYAPRLNQLHEQFRDQAVGFIAINSNTQDSITEIAAYARRHQIEFPLLKDVGNVVADQFAAVRTPEVFVLDRERVVRYWGRIDDQYGVGYVRDKASRQDLREAIAELLSGGEVTQPVTTSVGCYIGRVRKPSPDGTSNVTYSNQIARILQRNCTECHRAGDIAPFALTEYSDVVGWAETIAEVIHDRRMPPWHASPDHGTFANERRMTAEEVSLIDQWIADGTPEGDPQQLPEAISYLDGWTLPREPDLIVAMSPEPRRVPAEGVIEYQYLQVDPDFTEDKWIKAMEVRPGNRAVVHHILVFADSPSDGGEDFGGGVRGFLAGYVPGLRPAAFPDGMAKRIPAGSKLIFQMHYTPVGSEQDDLSHIGFVFADPEEIAYEVKTVSAFQPNIRIPKNESEHEETTKTRMHSTASLLGFMPHMHLRGKAFTYLAKLPDRDEWTTLLDVPRYDFNWQTNYRLAEPMELPAGTVIKCNAVFDNSDDNLANPDPNQVVTWGDQTSDEMLIGYFDIAVPVSGEASAEPSRQDRELRRAEEFILQMDKNDDFVLQMSEVPLRMKFVFSGADEDHDGDLTPAEVVKFFAERRRQR